MKNLREDEIRSLTCCFSGHREIPSDLHSVMNQRTEEAISWMYSRGYRRFVSGGATGFDTYAAFHVLKLKETHPDIELVLALPYKKPADSDLSSVHGKIIESADYVVYTSDKYSPSCMHIRNRFMVDLSSTCLCWMQHNDRGGTAYTVDYAQTQNLEIYNLYSDN